MLSRRMNAHAARCLEFLAQGREFEGESLVNAARAWREFAGDMRQMELSACSRDELFEAPAVAGESLRARSDVLSARLCRVAEELEYEFETQRKIPARHMLEWIGGLLIMAGEVSDFETRRSPRPAAAPADIEPAPGGNVVRLTPGARPGKKGAER